MGLHAHIDFETRSTVDLKKAGVHRYAEHPNTGVWVLCYRVPRPESRWRPTVKRWRPGDEPPYELLEHIESGGRVIAHNAMFERTIWNMLVDRGLLPGPKLTPDMQDCTMARAQAIALPAGLEKVGEVLEAPIQKDKDGHAIMMRLCRPRRVGSDGEPVWWDDPVKINQLELYCGRDVESEEAVEARLPPLSASEREIWILDQRINDRGVQLDTALISRAIEVVKAAKARADDQIWRLTDGAVKKCTETAKIVAWLDRRGVPCTSIAKGEIEDLIDASRLQGDEVAEQVIARRQAAAKTSTDKFAAMDRSVCADGRGRGVLAYAAASTLRWGGRLWQPQNLPRVDEERDGADVAIALDFLRSSMTPAAVAEAIEIISGRPALDVLSKCARSMIIAAPKKKLRGADWSNIEGRLGAWISGETWKLAAFAAYDAGEGPDLYRVAYSRTFGGTPEEANGPKRQIGKVEELASLYQGAVGAYISMGAVYGVKPGPMAEFVRAAVDDATWLRSQLKYTTQMSHGLDEFTWTGVRVAVDLWRDAHPCTVQGWWDLQDAAIDAVANPGVVVPVFGGKVRYLFKNKFLWCRLPSGDTIAYCKPVIRWVDTGRKEADGSPILKRQLFYWGVDSRTKKWSLQSLYGGKQFENIVQATARSLLKHAIIRLEAADMPVVLHVHDEPVTEVPIDDDRLALFERIMTEPPAWLTDFPLAAKAWEDTRYAK